MNTSLMKPFYYGLMLVIIALTAGFSHAQPQTLEGLTPKPILTFLPRAETAPVGSVVVADIRISGPNGAYTVRVSGPGTDESIELSIPNKALGTVSLHIPAVPGAAIYQAVIVDKGVEKTKTVTAVATTGVTEPKPDLAIRADNSGDWLGETVINQDGTDQTLERVATSSHVVRGQIKLSVANAQNGQTVTWSVPDWDAFRADGWTAKFFDAPLDGTEITAQITGEGWTTTHAEGIERVISWEVTAPADAADVTRVLSVRAQVAGGVADVVRVTVKVPALVSVQPDVSISPLDESGLPGDWVGEGELSPTEQSVSKVWGAGETHKFALKIKNTGTQAAAFALTAPTLPDGWTLKIYDALEAGTLLEGEVVTPSIAPNESVSWRVEVTAGAAAQQAQLAFRLSSAALFDEVEIGGALQKLVGLQWSRDGKSWQDVNDTTLLQVEQQATIGLRGVKAFPDVDWPSAQPMGPKWNWQGSQLDGETAWLPCTNGTPMSGETANATLGDSLPVKIRVLPAYDVLLSLSNGHLLAGGGTSPLTRTSFAAYVVDEEGNALPGFKVRLRALTYGDVGVGKWGDTALSTQTLTTDAGAKIQTTWTSDDYVGEVQLIAQVLDPQGQPFGEASVLTVQTVKPYSLLKASSWVQDANGQWSRSVAVSTWFSLNRLGNQSLSLSAQVSDYESGQPVAGGQNAAPFDAATGTSDAEGNFTTTQRWNPIEPGDWPHDYKIEVTVQ